MEELRKIIQKKLLESFLSLNEHKQTGILYHVTGLKNACDIIKDNQIRGSYFGHVDKQELGISTTRNKRFLYDENFVQFVLDGDKISFNYKIRPHDYWERNYNVPGEPQTKDEDEEIILVPKEKLFNLNKYLIKVNIFKTSLSKEYNELVELLKFNNINYSTQ